MNLLDLIVLIPISYFAVMGFKNGLIREVLGITGIFLSVFLTFNYMEPVSSLMKQLAPIDPEYLPFVSGLIIFIGTLAAVQMIAWAIKKFLEKVNLSTVNRIFGLIFGTLKSSIIISALLILLSGFRVPGDEIRQNSVSYPFLIQIAPATFNIVSTVYPGSEDFADTIKKTVKDYNPLENLLNEKK